MTLEIRSPTTVDEFLGLAGELLIAREAEHNLILGLCGTIAGEPEVYPAHRLFVVLDDAVAVGAALQTPPHKLILSEMSDAAAGALAEALAPEGLPGVGGPTRATEAFVERWRTRARGDAVLERHERIYRLERVTPPRPAAGSWRIADDHDHALVQGWGREFEREAMHGGLEVSVPDPGVAPAAPPVVRRSGRTMYLWEDGDRVVSMAGAGSDTPSGRRIGPVYTPPALRGHGYASNLVAAASQAQLDGGRRFCFLYTDLANPTSNKIYVALGYEPVCDVDQYRFDPGI